jgi:hypothetical protein
MLPSEIMRNRKGQYLYSLRTFDKRNLDVILCKSLRPKNMENMRKRFENRKFGVAGKKPFDFPSIKKCFGDV